MTLRLCSYNVEHFNRLFASGSNNLSTTPEDQAKLAALGTVLTQIDADVIGIVEAPNTNVAGTEQTVARLETFANAIGIRANRAVVGFVSDGAQEIAVLHTPGITVAHDPGGVQNDPDNPRFDGEFRVDTDEDTIQEIYQHYRPPLEVSVSSNQHQFHLIVVHVKSKGISNAVDLVHWDLENQRSRRKLLAECTWIRKRVDEWLALGRNVVVMGDMNDGPGMDFYERQLGRSAMEIVMGDLFDAGNILQNLAGRPSWNRSDGGWKPSSARFKDRFTEDFVNVLIDHILVSQGLALAPNNPHRIWNPFEDKTLEAMRDTFTTASDHFPVTLDLA